MDETFKVTCPDCDNILVVRRRDGKVLEVRRPIVDESTGDRFQDAFQKVKGRARQVDDKVADLKRKEQDRLKGADDFFKEALKRAQKDKEKPVNPLDRD